MAPTAPPPALSKEEKEALAAKSLNLFLGLGLDKKTAQNALANSKVTTNLTDCIHEAKLEGGCDKSVGNLVYTVATKYPANALVHRPVLLKYVTDGKLKSVAQLEAAFTFLSSVGSETLNLDELEKKSGVGVVVTLEEMKSEVTATIKKEEATLLEERYRYNVGLLLAQVKTVLPWADGKALKEEVDAQVKSLLGEKTPEDEAVAQIKKKGDKKKTALTEKATDKAPEKAKAASVDSGVAKGEATEKAPEVETDPYAIFPKPEENNMVHTEVYFSNGDVWRPKNSKSTLEKHLAVTGGKVWTRFPPEPNGYLHIGHAKAMYVDFGLAKETGGDCYLRFDDTNPEAEKQEYIDHIKEIVEWLGWKPFKITHSADYFQELYDLAVELIKRGCAYVDHQTPEEIKEFREKHLDSPWRNRPVEESLKLFDEMKKGLVEEGTATLRMKQDMKNENPNMYDLIAYRIKFTPHPRSGDAWCIYPSYDYTHCIVDSLENITHSLCTLEFESRRASYYWLLEALSLYHPYVWEYARLSITHTVLSKRKLNRLVTDHFVDGWDDPRLMTLSGLRRRGASKEAINSFCRAVGITRSDNLIKVELFEHFVRDDLNRTAPRALVVLKPLKITLVNIPEDEVSLIDAKLFPDAKEGDPEGTYKVPLTRVVYIESSDFRLVDSKDFYGLAPGKTVMLRYAFPITCTEVSYDLDGKTVKEIRAECLKDTTKKLKGVLHWVSNPSPSSLPLSVEVRLFDRLFLSENPNDSDDWLADLNPNSKEVISNALAVPQLAKATVGQKIQFERLGFFCVDTDSTPEKLVFNRTVTLKESYPKFGKK